MTTAPARHPGVRPLPRHAARLLVAALLAALLAVLAGLAGLTTPALGAPTTTAQDAGDTTWSVVPADASGPDGRISLRHEVDPGATVSDAVAVTNLGADAAEFVVAAGDGILGDGGAFDISAETPVAGGSWLAVQGLGGQGGDRVTLAAGETRVLPVTLTVPEDATPGDHPAGIVVARSGSDGSLTVTHRIGVRLHLRVTGEIAPQLELGDVAREWSGSLVPFGPGTVTLTYDVTNTGNVRLGGAVVASTSGPFGLAGTESEVDRIDELLPGDTVTRTVELRAWPTLWTSGDLELTPLVVAADQVADPRGDAVAHGGPAVPWTGLLVLVLLAVAVWWRRRTTRPGSAPGETDGSDGPGARREPAEVGA
ncbi:hypothetical protein RDV89_11470 [Nocardioides zeae]|uniref:DUF916 domain-containing protein n=1 Tax=Nocardioides imazamoxiresistens TaxID=3231893 RepID=A0ABU3PWS9_9ACTN|nr:hypothetical protein [Nocardioides zeae]MDT9593690.1 hypothetical protein [Nocardioides zeae]